MPSDIFKSNKDKKWYFHIKGNNGKIIVPSQPYSRRDSAAKGLEALKRQILKDEALRLDEEGRV